MYSLPTQSRRGVTLLEVLFAVLIGAIGLLGAIALLPVASEQARKGRQADATAIAGESFVNDIVNRRYFDPDNWIAHDGSNYVLHYGNGWYNSGGTASTPATAGNMPTCPVIGDSFCLDPRGMSLYDVGTYPGFRFFPYFANPSSVPNNWPRMHRVGIPGRVTGTAGGGLRGYTFSPATQSLTDLIATCADDLITEKLETDRTIPARQSFNPNAPSSYDKLTRESEGRISWIATLCPNLGNVGDEYILSVVCFYNRPLPVALPDTSAEREITQILLNGGGVTGGEITLGDNTEANLALHTGDWIMLKGPKNPTSSYPARYRWYRVLDTEVQARQVSSAYVRDATIFGPDWGLPQDETQAVLLTGVTAVYERTIRIQRSSLWP